VDNYQHGYLFNSGNVGMALLLMINALLSISDSSSPSVGTVFQDNFTDNYGTLLLDHLLPIRAVVGSN